MFLVRRQHVPDVSKLVAPYEKAHEDHISAFSKTIMSARLVTEQGATAGVLSVSGHETWEDIKHYVHQDPFTIAGAYSNIEIAQLELYLLDAGYARAPEWFLNRYPEMRPRFTPVKREGRR